MDSTKAFAMGQANKDNPLMVFDWNKAAQRIKETEAQNASAGLAGDWEWTGGNIWDGSIVPESETYTYLASTWAKPELEMNGATEDCFVMEDAMSNEWKGGNPAKIYWPESARKIVSA